MKMKEESWSGHAGSFLSLLQSQQEPTTNDTRLLDALHYQPKNDTANFHCTSGPSHTFNQKSMNETNEAVQLFNSCSWDSDNPSMLCWTNDSSRCRQLRGVQGEIMANLWSQYSGSSVTLGGIGNRLFEFYKFAQLFWYCSWHICVANLFSTFKQPISQKWC